MSVDDLKEMTRLRDKALSRAADLNGFRKYWKDKYNDMVRKFDAAQAHAWDMEQGADTLESMLTHASKTIARLEGRWRAPGAAKVWKRVLVVEQGTLFHRLATLQKDGTWCSFVDDIKILAWCELPPIPSDEMYAGLE